MQEKVALPEDLLLKYLKGELNEGDQIMLDEWLAKAEQNRILFEYIMNDKNLSEELKNFRSSNPDAIKAKLEDHWPSAKVVKMRRYVWLKITTAAAVVILLSIGAFVWFTGKQDKEVATTGNQTKNNDLEPGKDGAILKLADGKEIVLDNSANGNLATQGGTDVIKQGSALQYNNGGSNATEVVFNTLSTPRGRQFQLVLPDGSRVWLNSASSITFPTAFTGKDRQVQVQGEVYMVVAKDASRPFKVSVNGMQIEVLGTSFNINAYGDDGTTKTALLEGKVKVRIGSKLATLAPGQMAEVKDDNVNVIHNADTEAAVAWKEGMIVFNGADLKTFFNEIGRWYNVDVMYQGEVNAPEIYGTTPRNTNLSQILKFIEQNTKLKITLDGDKLIVQQK